MDKPLVINLTLEDSLVHSKDFSVSSFTHIHRSRNNEYKAKKSAGEMEAAKPQPKNEKLQTEEIASSVSTVDNPMPEENASMDSQADAQAVSPTSDRRESIMPDPIGSPEVIPKAHTITSGGVSPYENSTDSTGGYLKDHFSYIKALIQRNAIYPIFARKMGWEGKTMISFFISSDGSARDIKIEKSSGKGLLDQNAINAVRRASPFPRPPVEAQLIIPVFYKLH